MDPVTPACGRQSGVVEDERLIGAYTVTLWHNTADDAWGFDNIVTDL